MLHIDKARADAWTREEGAEGWRQGYKSFPLKDHWLKDPTSLGDAGREVVCGQIEKWRGRFFDLLAMF